MTIFEEARNHFKTTEEIVQFTIKTQVNKGLEANLRVVSIFWVNQFGLSNKVAYFESWDDAEDCAKTFAENCIKANGNSVLFSVYIDGGLHLTQKDFNRG